MISVADPSAVPLGTAIDYVDVVEPCERDAVAAVVVAADAVAHAAVRAAVALVKVGVYQAAMNFAMEVQHDPHSDVGSLEVRLACLLELSVRKFQMQVRDPDVANY